jgi:hypothetical protein
MHGGKNSPQRRCERIGSGKGALTAQRFGDARTPPFLGKNGRSIDRPFFFRGQPFVGLAARDAALPRSSKR